MDNLIIGGGAAGLMCAGFAARAGKKVTVLERNASFARKVRITGKGRCNVTNNCPPEEIIRNVRTNPRFLYSAVNAFSPADTMALFEGLGVPLKTERGRRVFPVSDRADDIASALIRFAQDNGASLLTGKPADPRKPYCRRCFNQWGNHESKYSCNCHRRNELSQDRIRRGRVSTGCGSGPFYHTPAAVPGVCPVKRNLVRGSVRAVFKKCGTFPAEKGEKDLSGTRGNVIYP